MKIGKPYIMLSGDGISRTKVVLSETDGALNDMATLEIDADNFMAKNIAFFVRKSYRFFLSRYCY